MSGEGVHDHDSDAGPHQEEIINLTQADETTGISSVDSQVSLADDLIASCTNLSDAKLTGATKKINRKGNWRILFAINALLLFIAGILIAYIIIRDKPWLLPESVQLRLRLLPENLHYYGARTVREPDGAEMVLVRDGAFAMGTQLAARDEGPRHLVYTSRFFIDRYEVTNRQYRAFCEAKGYPEPAGTTFVNNKRSDDFMPWQSERFNRDDMPVVCVSYADAHEYTQWLNAILPWDSDWETDLPTEAEWEKAAAGMQGLPYPWGSTADPKRVVMGGGYDETAGLKDAKAMPSGMSPFGLHHCLGNAKEWCLDWYNPSTYSLRIQKGRNGICATDPVGPSDGQLRCLRGGGWADSLSAIRCQTRDGAEPGIKRDDVGFRCVVRLKARARRKS